MKYIHWVIVLLLVGCRHPIQIIGEGDVISSSGNRDCLLEDFHAGKETCIENEVTEAYQETYYASPREGWQFMAWGHYCAKARPIDQCGFDISQELIDEYELEEVPPLIAYFRRKVTASHHAVFVGGSFTDPYARSLPEYARLTEFRNHSQGRIFAGGLSNNTGNLWYVQDADYDAIKAALDKGSATLFGINYIDFTSLFGGYVDGFDPEYDKSGLRNWINYALSNNPNLTSVFINPLHSDSPGQYDYKEYKRRTQSQHNAIHSFIDVLRSEFPTLDIYCVPQSSAAQELKKLYDTGKLPEINALIGASETSIFRDDMGHMGDITIRLGSLIWLRAIYGVDLYELDYQDRYSIDLRVLATEIMNKHDHRYDAS